MGWNKQEKIQKISGIPVAQSSLWEQTLSVWHDSAKYIINELYKLAAEGAVWYSDDTGARILETMKEPTLEGKKKRACHTTVICTKHDQHKIIVYQTGQKYCRENWSELLKSRKNPDKIILMTDASNQSLAGKKDSHLVEQSICLGGHARRKFTDITEYYPEICSKFTELVSQLYRNDALCKNNKMSDQERLEYHQAHSQQVIDEIYQLIDILLANKKVEPNCSLGKAFKYWLNHKKGLTAFLRIAGAPLDNNTSENGLRIRAIQRKITLFNKTEFSAEVMDDMNSLVATCEANGINVRGYLIWTQVNWKQVQENPNAYVPWKFQEKPKEPADGLLHGMPISSEISSNGIAVMN